MIFDGLDIVGVLEEVMKVISFLGRCLMVKMVLVFIIDGVLLDNFWEVVRFIEVIERGGIFVLEFNVIIIDEFEKLVENLVEKILVGKWVCYFLGWFVCFFVVVVVFWV